MVFRGPPCLQEIFGLLLQGVVARLYFAALLLYDVVVALCFIVLLLLMMMPFNCSYRNKSETFV
jgi:hypothetical protein